MFSSDNGIKSMGEAIERVKNAPDARAFEDVVCHLRTYMKNLEMDSRFMTKKKSLKTLSFFRELMKESREIKGYILLFISRNFYDNI